MGLMSDNGANETHGTFFYRPVLQFLLKAKCSLFVSTDALEETGQTVRIYQITILYFIIYMRCRC